MDVAIHLKLLPSTKKACFDDDKDDVPLNNEPHLGADCSSEPGSLFGDLLIDFDAVVLKAAIAGDDADDKYVDDGDDDDRYDDGFEKA
jgi:hypothetical protein